MALSYQELLAKARAASANLPKEPIVQIPAPIHTTKPTSALEALRQKLAARKLLESTPAPISPEITAIVSQKLQETGTDRYGKAITYNAEQSAFIETVSTGASAILIGAAGTGKTTCMNGAITALIHSGKAGILNGDGHKHLPVSEVPGIVVCAYTRRATNNIRRVMPSGMEGNCITIHKLLEYAPVYYEVFDEESGESKNTMRFEATRNRFRTLPSSIHTIIFEESSMIAVELYREVIDALAHPVQFIFLGDIQQLPPVFGSAILGYKMLELRTVELVQVYRQALESPIIRLAHRILSGTPIHPETFHEWDIPQKLKLHPWKKKLHADVALLTAAKFFTSAIAAGSYDVDSDIILIPFNKSFGTDELNKHIAGYLSRTQNRETHEIIAGFMISYYAVGDKVLYDKEDATIVSISHNGNYVGKAPQTASVSLDRWGYDDGTSLPHTHHISPEESEADVDRLLELMSTEDSKDAMKREASHVITLRMNESDEEITLSSAGEVNALTLGYSITIHKSQGSEWRKVFLVLHQSHNTMLQRELLYTACTRAREELYIICEPDSFIKGINNQKIKGNTLAEKAEFFKGLQASKQTSIVP